MADQELAECRDVREAVEAALLEVDVRLSTEEVSEPLKYVIANSFWICMSFCMPKMIRSLLMLFCCMS